MHGLTTYRCFKEVNAAKIKEISCGRDDGNGPGATLRFFSGGSVCVGESYMSRHDPKDGGYYVVYKDGYESFSPAEAFELGYAAA